MRFRPTLVKWHRWFGVLAAVWLITLAATGSIIVFYDELDTALNRDQRLSDGAGEAVSPAQLVETAERSLPGTYVSFYDAPADARETVRVFLAPRIDSTEAPEHGAYAFLDPYSGALLGFRTVEEFGLGPRQLMDTIYQLHIDLFLGEWMIWFLGLVAFLWVLDHLVAIALSFPKARLWRRSFLIRGGGHRGTYEAHRAIGLWLLPLTFVLAFSGIYFNWMETFEHAVDAVSPLTPRHSELVPARGTPTYDPPVTFAKAIETSRRTASGAVVDMISYNARKGIYEARIYDPRDIDSYGRRLVTIDASSGAVLDDRHTAAGTAGDVFVAWQYPLHSGKAFGWAGRLAVFTAGIATIFLTVTGLMIWRRKARSRKR